MVVRWGKLRSFCFLCEPRQKMEAKTKKEPTALEIGYKVVTGIGYKHSQLVSMDCGVNYPTLRRIKSGGKVKKCTEEYYLRLFVNLINKEYERRV